MPTGYVHLFIYGSKSDMIVRCLSVRKQCFCEEQTILWHPYLYCCDCFGDIKHIVNTHSYFVEHRHYARTSHNNG